jgi:hypothetical protein
MEGCPLLVPFWTRGSMYVLYDVGTITEVDIARPLRSRREQVVDWYLDELLSLGSHLIQTVTTQARQEIRIWRGLTQRHMGVRGRTVT